MVDNTLASANRVPRVLLAHAKNSYSRFARTQTTTHVYPSDTSRVFFNLPTDGTEMIYNM